MFNWIDWFKMTLTPREVLRLTEAKIYISAIEWSL